MFKAVADQGIGFYAQIFVRTSLFFAARFTMRERVRFSTQNQGFPCSLLLYVNWILSGSWSRHRVIFSKLISEPTCSSQIDLHWASPQRICGPFLEFIHVFRFFQPACFLIYIETAQNSHEECNEFADLLFWRLSLCLSRESLTCYTPSLDLCILFKFIFLYLW